MKQKRIMLPLYPESGIDVEWWRDNFSSDLVDNFPFVDDPDKIERLLRELFDFHKKIKPGPISRQQLEIYKKSLEMVTEILEQYYFMGIMSEAIVTDRGEHVLVYFDNTWARFAGNKFDDPVIEILDEEYKGIINKKVEIVKDRIYSFNTYTGEETTKYRTVEIRKI